MTETETFELKNTRKVIEISQTERELRCWNMNKTMTKTYRHTLILYTPAMNLLRKHCQNSNALVVLAPCSKTTNWFSSHLCIDSTYRLSQHSHCQRPFRICPLAELEQRLEHFRFPRLFRWPNPHSSSYPRRSKRRKTNKIKSNLKFHILSIFTQRNWHSPAFLNWMRFIVSLFSFFFFRHNRLFLIQRFFWRTNRWKNKIAEAQFNLRIWCFFSDYFSFAFSLFVSQRAQHTNCFVCNACTRQYEKNDWWQKLHQQQQNYRFASQFRSFTIRFE